MAEPLEFETAWNNLKSLREWYASRAGNRNEATTRLQLIDKLFFECLGWLTDDVVLEESHGQQYADYTFNAPRHMLIVEAKREGTYFELPVGVEGLEFSIPTLSREYPDLRAAIQQAASYCQARGVPFGAVSNGHQIVAFVANRNDGVPPLDGRALVFAGLDSMLFNFRLLWDVLSKPGVEGKVLHRRLVGESQPDLPVKLSGTLPVYPGIKNRNVFQTDLQIVSELVLEDLSRSRELESQFLAECYCPTGALSQYALVSKQLLEARYAALFEDDVQSPTTVSAVDKHGLSPDLVAQSLSRRPVLLIGDVGVGKTTFIRHLVKVDAAALFSDAVTLYIDLGTQATLAATLRGFVVEEMYRQLRDLYGVDIEEKAFVTGVYHFELLRFEKGIYGDLKQTTPDEYRRREIEFLAHKLESREEHLKYSLEHLAKGRRQQIVILIDNCDQRDDDTQQQAFLIAQEIAEHWPAMVFVALRPETFHRSLKVGALTGYHPKAFTISPPRIDLVIHKRLWFALRITSGEIPIETLAHGTKIKSDKLDRILRIFLRSLEKNDELAECIDNISAGNVRAALDLVKDFFGSGHVYTEKIVETFEQGGYTVPLHEFLRAVIYGDSIHYDPDRSPVANLFDVAFPDAKEHFLLPYVISLLSSFSGPDVEEGFVEVASRFMWKREMAHSSGW